MKRLVLALFMMTAILSFVSCSSDENIQPEVELKTEKSIFLQTLENEKSYDKHLEACDAYENLINSFNSNNTKTLSTI